MDEVNEFHPGKLLIASPVLSDFFERAVVLLIEHNEDGAMGLVLNRPVGDHGGRGGADAVRAWARTAR